MQHRAVLAGASISRGIRKQKKERFSLQVVPGNASLVSWHSCCAVVLERIARMSAANPTVVSLKDRSSGLREVAPLNMLFCWFRELGGEGIFASGCNAVRFRFKRVGILVRLCAFRPRDLRAYDFSLVSRTPPTYFVPMPSESINKLRADRSSLSHLET